MLTSNTLMLPPAQTITLLITISFAMIKSKRISIPRVTLAWKFQETEYWHWPRLVSSPHIGRYISHFQVKSPLFLRSDNSKFLGNFHVEVPFFYNFQTLPMISWLSPGMFSFFKTIDYFKNFKGVCYFMSNLYSSWFFEYFVNFHQLTCDVLRDLVPFVLYKKREKHPWRSVNFSSKVADFSLQLY